MTKVVTCMAPGCGGTLANTMPLENRGPPAKHVNDPPIEQTETGTPYIRCPKCGAKNGLLFSSGASSGNPGTYSLTRILK